MRREKFITRTGKEQKKKKREEKKREAKRLTLDALLTELRIQSSLDDGKKILSFWIRVRLSEDDQDEEDVESEGTRRRGREET